MKSTELAVSHGCIYLAISYEAIVEIFPSRDGLWTDSAQSETIFSAPSRLSSVCCKNEGEGDKRKEEHGTRDHWTRVLVFNTLLFAAR